MREEEFTERYGRMGIISSTQLSDTRFARINWLAEGLLKPGLSVLAGAPKIGKSWMVLQLCMAVAKGEPFMGMATRRSSVLYITLEDSEARIQERINRITEETSDNLYIALNCSPLGEELASEIANFTIRHRDAGLVVIDTFQKIREQTAQMSYSGDYADISYLKKIADELHITILLVHHTRKLGDSDVINEISGTNGIAGSADTLMILKKKNRSESSAVLSCTGRDIEDRCLVLTLDREFCQWRIVSDGAEREPEQLPPILTRLISYVAHIGEFSGSNTEFCRRFCAHSQEDISPNRLKYLMNRYRYDLEDAGVRFLSVRKHAERLLAVTYSQPDDGVVLPVEDAAREEALFSGSLPDFEEIPLSGGSLPDFEEIPFPTDADAPPERGGSWYYETPTGTMP